jgi:hypothetical protein
MLRSVDNKDRWIATVDLPRATLKPVHRLTDEAWVNYDNSEFGWLPDNSHAVVPVRGKRLLAPVHADAAGRTRALTQGKWEAGDVRGRATAAPPGCCATARIRAPTRSAPSTLRTAARAK